MAKKEAEDEGYGLEEEPEEEQSDEIEDYNDDIETDLDIGKIIIERNKLHNEINIREPDYKERIGRLNLDLFGDPDNPDWESKLDKLNEELEMPMTRTHPIAAKTKSVVREIKDLQIEYNSLHKFYKKYVKEVGTLLDNSIKLHQNKVKEWDIERGVDGVKQGPKIPITTGIVQDYLDKEGAQVWIDKYNAACDAGHVLQARSAKGAFVAKGIHYFKKYDTDPKWVAQKVFIKLTQNRIPIEKNISPEEREKQHEANQPLSKDLSDAPDTNNAEKEEENKEKEEKSEEKKE